MICWERSHINKEYQFWEIDSWVKHIKAPQFVILRKEDEKKYV